VLDEFLDRTAPVAPLAADFNTRQLAALRQAMHRQRTYFEKVGYISECQNFIRPHMTFINGYLQ
jgi:hypothetical protein